MIVVQKWLVFPKDVSETTKRWHLSRNLDICGFFDGVPPRLSWQAEEEGWKLPYLYSETVEVPE